MATEKKKKNNKNESSASSRTPREKVILVAMAIVMAPILLVILQNVRHSISIAGQIRELNKQAEVYQSSIEKDSLLLESIKNDEGLEQFARETYYMQRRGERVFIIEE